MLDNAQLALILSSLGVGGAALLAFVRWVVLLWMDDRKVARTELREDRKEDRAATVAVATAIAEMSVRFESFERSLDGMQGSFAEVSGMHHVPPEFRPAPIEGEPPRTPTPRPGTIPRIVERRR